MKRRGYIFIKIKTSKQSCGVSDCATVVHKKLNWVNFVKKCLPTNFTENVQILDTCLKGIYNLYHMIFFTIFLFIKIAFIGDYKKNHRDGLVIAYMEIR